MGTGLHILQTNGMDPSILTTLPTWILTVIALMWAMKQFGLPWWEKATTNQSNEMKLKEIQAQVQALEREVDEWKSKYEKLDMAYRTLEGKYNALFGMLRGFRVYLKEKGVADFPLFDELDRHTADK